MYFTCIVTCFNRENTIERAIKSILNQSYQNFEIIVVDDASQDQSTTVIDRISDKRLKIVRHKINKGQNAALNTGIASARYSYLAFLDSDDAWLPEYLYEMSRVYLENPIIRFAYSNLVKGPVWTLGGEDKYAEVLNQGYLSSMITITAKKEAVIAAGGFDLKYKICQDDDFCFRMAKLFSFKVITKELAIVHGDENSMTRNQYAVAKGWAFLIQNYRRDILNYCGRNVYSKHILNVAMRFFECNRILTGIYYYLIALYYIIVPFRKKFPYTRHDFWVNSINILRMYYGRLKKVNQTPDHD
ncbi:glycosyltransferase family 2 protein [Pedobacter sp. HDW13]|uniref:glycosyltransferase family 2 protein n=1 Tax=Pedobacter sp. HDW13 TaxID=2714940 RepID=UPI00140DEDA1|nr:glycosyltransferase family A protein [Pedobacter sp. HDW13]QIL40676.1 glycosyltransferase family 2 protein [Pedobacter sp. HDW13]